MGAVVIAMGMVVAMGDDADADRDAAGGVSAAAYPYDDGSGDAGGGGDGRGGEGGGGNGGGDGGGADGQ